MPTAVTPKPVVPSVVPSGSDIPLNLDTAGEQTAPHLAALVDGGFVASWANYPDGSPDSELHFQVFDADGARRGSEHAFTVHSADGAVQAVVGLSDGNFELAWSQYGQVG